MKLCIWVCKAPVRRIQVILFCRSAGYGVNANKRQEEVKRFMSRAIEIAGNRLVWRHIQRENQRMILDPLGYDPIKDIDEIHHRNRRKTDDPYIKATSEKITHRFPKIDDAERR